MTQAEQIREYFKKHPSATYDEVAEGVKTTNSTVRTNVCRDLKNWEMYPIRRWLSGLLNLLRKRHFTN